MAHDPVRKRKFVSKEQSARSKKRRDKLKKGIKTVKDVLIGRHPDSGRTSCMAKAQKQGMGWKKARKFCADMKSGKSVSKPLKIKRVKRDG